MGGINTDYDSAFRPDCQDDDEDNDSGDDGKNENYGDQKPSYGGNNDDYRDDGYNDEYKPRRRLKTRGRILMIFSVFMHVPGASITSLLYRLFT